MASALDDDEITGINVTPLVDITLVLLIVFMMTTSFIVSPAIHVDLPKATTAEPTPQSTLSLVLTRQGTLYLNNTLVELDDVRRYIRTERGKGKELQAVLAADAQVTHGRVVGVIDLVKSEGVTSFALDTDAEFSSETARPNGESGGR
ncbi:MAG: Biopolymer transport protein ExbD/TolR [Myxococcales bacterium]|nr:Biopolymer transport protein ExbD/TolR [Myxococcales bacterium]